ncbi:MAG: FtsW/RodA/SpoVE family cell cycle protein, partial [Acidobacteriaceae bacterium]|nr:FtsW/RodA/SpoVE family cell cycle protein [Acidobacteriaceae bacterium]
MKVSKEEIAAHAQEQVLAEKRVRAASRNTELIFLILASVLVAAGLYLVFSAKTRNLGEVQKATLNLNELTGPQQLVPLLGIIPSSAEQYFIANRIYNLKRRGEQFSNVGAIAKLRVTETELAHTRGLPGFSKRLATAREHAKATRRELSIPLLTPTELAALKPHLRVRNPDSYRQRFLLWTVLFFAAFYLTHLVWRIRGFAGDNLILSLIHALSGIGLILMISLRDPLRDTLMFADFTTGVLAGCLALLLFSIPDYHRQLSRLSYVPLLAALFLAVALGLFGSGPGGSDAKINLFFFQPVELIRILLILFLAGYFAQNWDALRYLKQRGGRLADASRRFNIPRLDYLLPVAAGVAVSIFFFFWLSDLGPALVIGCLFLTMYSIARNRVLLAAAGLSIIILSFALGYVTGFPHTVRERVEMWKSPWDNHVRGGDQLADSMWSLSTGGATGTGLGLGDAQTMPAAHTDLIISAFGEEAGALSILALYLLYAILIYRGLRIALRAPETYSFFLVTGLTLIIAFQLLLITGGLLGLIPLSGVVSPFLSYGKTSMVANFILFAIILSVSAKGGKESSQAAHFGSGMRALEAVLAALVVIVLGRFFWIQVVKADNVLVRPSLVMQADGVRRYQYNPRLLEVARSVPKGTIFDRNGIPLATSNPAQIEAHRADYQKLGITLDQTISNLDSRQYPFGAPMFYLLGDVRTRLKAGATNTAFQENASRIRLQGYDDVA